MTDISLNNIAYLATVEAARDRLEAINNANEIAQEPKAAERLLPLDSYDHNNLNNGIYLDTLTYKYSLFDAIRAQLLGLAGADNFTAPATSPSISNQSSSAHYILSDAYNNSLVEHARDKINYVESLYPEIITPEPEENVPTNNNKSPETTYIYGDVYDNNILEEALAKLNGLTSQDEAPTDESEDSQDLTPDN